MLEHGPVDFFQDVGANFDDVVGSDAENEAVEGGVMQLAQRQAVRDDGFAFGIGVLDDVRGVEKLLVSQPAESALLQIGTQDPLTS